MPDVLTSGLGDAFVDLTAGLVALWLLASGLGWKHRALVWGAMLGIVGGFGLFVFGVTQAWDSAATELAITGVVTSATAFIISLALTLGGLLCRGRYGWLRLLLWVAVCTLGLSLLVMAPFAIFAMIMGQGWFALTEFFVGGLLLAGVGFAVQLPFLVLGFVNGFYRQRLKGLLHLDRTPEPPVIAPPPPTEAAVGI